MRNKILQESAKLIHIKGYKETSIQEIVEEIEMTKGAFYYYYKSKESLLMDIIEKYVDRLLAIQQGIVEQPISSKDKIIEIIKVLVDDLHNQIASGRIFYRDVKSLAPENEMIIREKREKFRLILEELIIDGQHKGEFRDALNPKITTMAIIGITNWTYNWFNVKGELTTDELFQLYVDFIFKGMDVP